MKFGAENAYNLAKAEIVAFCNEYDIDENGDDTDKFLGTPLDWIKAKRALVILCRLSLVSIAAAGGFSAEKIANCAGTDDELFWTIGQWNRLRAAVDGIEDRDDDFWNGFLSAINWR